MLIGGCTSLGTSLFNHLENRQPSLKQGNRFEVPYTFEGNSFTLTLTKGTRTQNWTLNGTPQTRQVTDYSIALKDQNGKQVLNGKVNDCKKVETTQGSEFADQLNIGLLNIYSANFLIDGKFYRNMPWL